MSEKLDSLTDRVPMDRTGSKPLPLDMFTLDQAVLEVRYEAAYLLWDRSGQMWHEIAKTEDKLRVLEAQPHRTAFAIEDRFQLAVNLENSRIQAFFPNRNLSDFAKKCDTFFSIVLQSLEVHDLSRVGLRLIYSREYPKIGDAGRALTDLQLSLLLPDKQFGVDTSNPRPEYSVRCEDLELGFAVRIRSETQTAEITPPPGARDIKYERFARHRILFDVDHYTTISLRHGQLKPSEWIKDRLHATNRDSKSFLGG